MGSVSSDSKCNVSRRNSRKPFPKIKEKHKLASRSYLVSDHSQHRGDNFHATDHVIAVTLSDYFIGVGGKGSVLVSTYYSVDPAIVGLQILNPGKVYYILFGQEHLIHSPLAIVM